MADATSAAAGAATTSTTVPTKITGLKSIKDLITSVANVGKSGIVDAVKGLLPGGSDFLKSEQQVRNMIKVYAMSSKQFINYSATMFKNATDMGFKWGATMEDLIKIQNDYNDEVGRNIQLTEKDYDAQLALGQVFGKTEKDVALAQRFSQGLLNYNHDIQSSVRLFEGIYQKAEGYGLNMDKIAQNIVQNLGMADKYNFKNGVKGVMDMALYAEKYRISMASAQGMIDKFGDSLEGSIEAAANLSNLGGNFQGINPVEYYRMAMTDPEALVKDLSERMNGLTTFDKQTGEFNVNGMQGEMMLREIAKLSGQDVGDLRKQMRERAKRSEVENQIKNKGLTDEQMTTISSKALWDSKNNEWYVTDTGNKRVSLKDVDNGNIENFMAGDRDKSVEEIGMNSQGIEKQLSNIETGIKASLDELTNKYIGPTMRDLSAMANSMTHKFIHNLPKNINKVGKSLDKFTSNISKIAKDVGSWLEKKASQTGKGFDDFKKRAKKAVYKAVGKKVDEDDFYQDGFGSSVNGNFSDNNNKGESGDNQRHRSFISDGVVYKPKDSDVIFGIDRPNLDYGQELMSNLITWINNSVFSGEGSITNMISNSSVSNGSVFNDYSRELNQEVGNASEKNININVNVDALKQQEPKKTESEVMNSFFGSNAASSGENTSFGGSIPIQGNIIPPIVAQLDTSIASVNPPEKMDVAEYVEQSRRNASGSSSQDVSGNIDVSGRIVLEGSNGQTTDITNNVMDKIVEYVISKINKTKFEDRGYDSYNGVSLSPTEEIHYI